MRLSIVIPGYNERKTFHEIVTAVRNVPVSKKEIIVVVDCSTDGTTDGETSVCATASTSFTPS